MSRKKGAHTVSGVVLCALAQHHSSGDPLTERDNTLRGHPRRGSSSID